MVWHSLQLTMWLIEGTRKTAYSAHSVVECPENNSMPTARPATRLEYCYCCATFTVMMSCALAGQKRDYVYIPPLRGMTRLGWNKWLGKTPGYFQNAGQRRRRRGLYLTQTLPRCPAIGYVMRSPCLLGFAGGWGLPADPASRSRSPTDLVSESRLSGLTVRLDLD